jgi:hypothetical protein
MYYSIRATIMYPLPYCQTWNCASGHSSEELLGALDTPYVPYAPINELNPVEDNPSACLLVKI